MLHHMKHLRIAAITAPIMCVKRRPSRGSLPPLRLSQLQTYLTRHDHTSRLHFIQLRPITEPTLSHPNLKLSRQTSQSLPALGLDLHHQRQLLRSPRQARRRQLHPLSLLSRRRRQNWNRSRPATLLSLPSWIGGDRCGGRMFLRRPLLRILLSSHSRQRAMPTPRQKPRRGFRNKREAGPRRVHQQAKIYPWRRQKW